MKKPIPMSSPDITAQEISAVVEVLQTPYLSIGPNIERFEAEFARYEGTRYAAGVSSGTAGLHLSVIASEVREGDWVLTTPFSFIASANCILYERAIPIFVDIDPATGNMDPHLAGEAIQAFANGNQSNGKWLPPSLRGMKRRRKTDGGELKAVVLVHAFGQPCDMEPVIAEARRFGIHVIEDACEALGAEYRGQKVGAFGDAAVFAFYPNKQMTTGEGGMIVHNREDWDQLFRSLRNQGRDIFDAWLNHSRLGYNYRLDEMSAALGLAQLKRIDELLAKRSRAAAWYNERLREISMLAPLAIAPTTTRMSWFVYIIRLSPDVDRDRLMVRLEGRGIPTRPYFTPIHLQPFYRKRFGYQPGDFPQTELAGRAFMALPFHGKMSEEQVEAVCEALKKELPLAALKRRNVIYVEKAISQVA
jgi:dTDP-4-amino-4,6-dideoxygalactose transaminase